MPKPGALSRPELVANGATSFRIVWSLPKDEDPEITATTIKVRIVGSQRFQNYDYATGKLVTKGGATVPAPVSEVMLEGCEEGIAYEAIIACMNADGWSDLSPPSAPMHNGALKPRAKPPQPAPPRLEAVSSGRLRVAWTVPQACPPVEATQVQITDVSTGLTLLVDAANGKLVSSGRTTFVVNRTECNVNGAADGVEYVAAICCRNAEGFGEYSIPSDGVANSPADAGAMQLVLHQGPSTEVPIMDPLSMGQMKIRWLIPEGAKSTLVKIRKVGDPNWYLVGGAPVQAPAEETVASGLEDGIEYESILSFLVNGRWSQESGISKPTCIGSKKLPDIPDAPKEPRIIVDQAQGGVKVRWSLFTAVPALTGASVRIRPVGRKSWQYVHPTSWHLSNKECDPIDIRSLETNVLGLTPGVRYEGCVAFRNKLGQGPYSELSDLACIGRPATNYKRCHSCSLDFDLQHVTYTRTNDTFWCPLCRFRQMDPFNAIVDPTGFLLCHIVVRPTIAFSLDLPDLKQWRKDDQAVFVRMLKVDCDTCSQVWPKKFCLSANGAEVVSIKEPEEGHIRRDVPHNIAPGLKPGMNTINITMEDDNICEFALCLVRTQTMTSSSIATATPSLAEDVAKDRIMTLLEDTWAAALDNEEDEEITCVISNKLKLRCPLSFERCEIPVRGLNCRHLQCFGLLAFLETNMKMRALNNRWTCPVCGTILKPQDLRRDMYVQTVLSETPEHIDEVLIMQDGSYRCIEEVPIDKAKVEREKAEKAAAEAAARADDPEITEMCHTIGDEQEAPRSKRKGISQPTVARTITKRQRARMARQAMVEDTDDSD